MNTSKELTNREMIASMIELGNLGKNTHIKGKTKEERLKKFKDGYYGLKEQKYNSDLMKRIRQRIDELIQKG